MLPHELVSKYVAPELRGLTTHFLSDRGLGQYKIAKVMGISQPMVNKLLSKPKEHYYSELEKIGIKRGEAERIAELSAAMLSAGKKLEYLSFMSSYLNSLLMTGRLCFLHRELFPGIPVSCDICMRIFQPATDPRTEEIRLALELLQSNTSSYRLIPEVGSNIVVADPDASSPEEVFGISGKIVAAENKIAVIGEPVRGGSRHTSLVLLAVKKKFPKLRSAFVSRYSERCIEALKKKGYRILFTGPHRSLEELYSSIAEAATSSREEPDAIADAGGPGIEPVIYIFAENASEAVKKAFDCF